MTLWICKLTESGGQMRLTIPKGLVNQMPFLTTGYVQLEDKYDDQIIIRGVKINAEKTTDGTDDIYRDGR